MVISMGVDEEWREALIKTRGWGWAENGDLHLPQGVELPMSSRPVITQDHAPPIIPLKCVQNYVYMYFSGED